MIISNERKILFIHVQRTGGVSISEILRQCLPDAVQILEQHSSIASAQKKMGGSISSYQSFAFVRNPWERVFSWFLFLTMNRNHTPFSQQNVRTKEIKLSFEEFLLTSYREKAKGNLPIPSQFSLIANASNKILINHIGRYETFEQDIVKIFKHLGIENFEIPKINRSRDWNYIDYYSPKSQKIVEELYFEDITRLEYRFNK